MPGRKGKARAGLDCPLCDRNFPGPNKLAYHLNCFHNIGKPISPCPCCNSHFYSGFEYHFKNNINRILTMLHAQLLGVNPHEK
jgi:hypothetical protein